MRENCSTYYVLEDDEYPFPTNDQRLQYLDQPSLNFVAYKDALTHRKEQRKHREKREQIANTLQSNRNECET